MSSDEEEHEEVAKGKSILRKQRGRESRGKPRLEVEYEMPEDSSKEKVTT